MKKIVLVAAFLATQSVYAIDFSITCKVGAYQAPCNTVKSDLESEAKENLPDVSLSKYGVGVSNSVAIAGRDNSDYSDKFSIAAVKAGLIGVGLDGDLDQLDSPGSVNGFGVQSTLQVGVNMSLLPIDKVGPIELSKLDVFASFFSQSKTIDNDDSTADGEISSMGFGARYQLVEGTDVLPGYMLEWGGLFVHAGYRLSKMSITLTQDVSGESESGGTTFEYNDAEASFEMDSTISSIPIEVSTYVRFLYIFTLYGGLGADLNSGSTDIKLKGNGSLTAKDSNGNVLANDVGSFSLGETDEGSAKSFVTRGFGGLQLNLPFVRFYAQAHKVFGEDVIGAQVGAKILY